MNTYEKKPREETALKCIKKIILFKKFQSHLSPNYNRQKSRILKTVQMIFFSLFFTFYLISPFNARPAYSDIEFDDCEDVLKMDENYFKRLEIVKKLLFQNEEKIIDKFIKMPPWAQWEYVNMVYPKNITEQLTKADYDKILIFKECK